MSIIFRKATISDAENLAKTRSLFLLEVADECPPAKGIEKAAISKLEAANKAYFEQNLPNNNFIAWIALENDKIVATSGMSFSIVPPNYENPDGKVAYIMNMFTLPTHRKQGLAAELFKRITEEAKHQGYIKITLNATEAGRRVYEKYGFKDVKGDMVFYVTD
ncbi:MAG: GNAT family N-acetyltransferase [Defluviitaleaceae bacterium]|nr:GNAT family N-acetyltransferase [Defluviitaleaceae bacterium]